MLKVNKHFIGFHFGNLQIIGPISSSSVSTIQAFILSYLTPKYGQCITCVSTPSDVHLLWTNVLIQIDSNKMIALLVYQIIIYIKI